MKRIIIAEDDDGIRDAITMILEAENYDVITIPDGYPLLENKYPPPDLYILDKRLSGVDGLDICKYLKTYKPTAHVPVIVLSANPNIVALAKTVGADFALEKPFKMKELKAVVEKFLSGNTDKK